MNIEVKHDNASSRFYIHHKGYESRLNYKMEGDDTINFLSTYVPEELRKKGYASQLVVEGLNYVRKNNLKVIPTCPFVKSFIQRHEEYKNLLA